MKSYSTRVLAAIGSTALGLCAFASPGSASAQVDTNPPLPNALMLIDTSGSMEYMMDSDPVTKKPRLPKCTPGDPNSINEQNRWATLLTVLTGEIPKFSCYPQSRSDANFISEYTIGSTPPYDKDYYLPFNRIVSWDGAVDGCTMGPDKTKWPAAGSIYAFPLDSLKPHRWNSAATACNPVAGQATNTIWQNNDGILDAFKEKVRFGLMTFDPSTSPGTGQSAGNLDAVTGMDGLWSYYKGWNTNAATYAEGMPGGCSTKQPIEVGGRNPAAPPWEGKFIGFGDPAADTATLLAQNDKIQQQLLSLRPYGATPLAGMLSDAKYFFYDEPWVDPSTSKPFGPKDDPYWGGGCRSNFIVLLTDGVPNLDLRPGCASNVLQPHDPPYAEGTCPYKKPSQIAYDLANHPDPKKRIQTFVVGFAISNPDGAAVSCKDLINTTSGQVDPVCNAPPNTDVAACCEMAQIAYNGGTGYPRFADNKLTLRQALNEIFSQVAAKTTSRTMPVFATTSSGGGTGFGPGSVVGFKFFTSFKVATGSLWQGVLERQRLLCVDDPAANKLTVEEQPIQKDKGDNFHDNLKSSNGPPRNLISVQAPLAASKYVSSSTLRPTTTINDGLGTYNFTQTTPAAPASFVTKLPVQVYETAVANASQSVCGTIKIPVAESTCANRIVQWEMGLPPVYGDTYTRQSPLGSIYHATPTVVGPPGGDLRDESYRLFSVAQAKRPLVLYTATTDGQLHAFQIEKSDASDPMNTLAESNNELWSFIPPAVLPRLKGLYPGVEQRLLDGAPQVRDVVFSRASSQVSTPASIQWKTVLTAGFGPSFPGYYAVDVTKPRIDTADPSSGPKFLWQVSSASNGNPLFGSSTTPIITTVYARAPGESEIKEIAVAILPGGDGAATPSLQCNRIAPTSPNWPTFWPARAKVRCYAAADPSRSVTVVRLDTGEVMRRFHNCAATNLPTELASRTTCAPFDSPITGVPVAYPSGTGQIATRAFVGDKDGTMWRLDFSDPNPANWTVEPFFDSYSKTAVVNEAQPIQLQPAVAVDNVGQLVVIFATGDQDLFTGQAGMPNVVWSVNEVPAAANLPKGKANWHIGRNETSSKAVSPVSLNWTGGERMAGPPTIFNGSVYFSSYRPPAAGSNACEVGTSTLWGVDYQRQESVTVDPNGDVTAYGALPFDSSGTVLPDAAPKPMGIYQSDALIFGVGVAQTPPCLKEVSLPDPYMGFGSGGTAISNIAPTSYQLVMHTGPKATSSITNAQTAVRTFNLPPPPPRVKISSWAAVVE